MPHKRAKKKSAGKQRRLTHQVPHGHKPSAPNIEASTSALSQSGLFADSACSSSTINVSGPSRVEPQEPQEYLSAATQRIIEHLSPELKAQYERWKAVAISTASYIGQLGIRQTNKNDAPEEELLIRTTVYQLKIAELYKKISYATHVPGVGVIIQRGMQDTYSKEKAELTKRIKIGNCGELCTIGFFHIKEKKDIPVIHAGFTNVLSHQFLITGLKPQHIVEGSIKNTLSLDIFNDPTVMVFDPWANYYFSIHALQSFLRSGIIENLLRENMRAEDHHPLYQVGPGNEGLIEGITVMNIHLPPSLQLHEKPEPDSSKPNFQAGAHLFSFRATNVASDASDVSDASMSADGLVSSPTSNPISVMDTPGPLTYTR